MATPGRGTSIATTSEAARCLEFARDRLALLDRTLPPQPGDVLELDIGSEDRLGLLLYPRQRRIAELAALVDQVLPAGPARDVQTALLRGIPAERHAVRLLAGDALSVFFKIDLPNDAIETVARGLGCEGAAAAAFLASTNRESACGMACEVSPAGAVRLRFYAMVVGEAALAEIVEPARQHLAIDLAEVVAVARLFARSGAEIVMNVGCAAGDAVSLKLEVPDVPFEVATSIPRSEEEQRTWSTCAELASLLQNDRLAYLGWRQHADGSRQIGFYLSASSLLQGPA